MGYRIITELLPNLETALSKDRTQLTLEALVLNCANGDVVRTKFVMPLGGFDKASSATDIITALRDYTLVQWELDVAPEEIWIINSSS